MPVTYQYHPEENLLHIKPTGRLSLEDITGYIERVLDDPAIKPGFIELVFFDQVCAVDVGYEEARLLRAFFGRLKEEKGHRASILIGASDYVYGLTRLFATVMQSTIAVSTVRSLKEAMAEVGRLREETRRPPP